MKVEHSNIFYFAMAAYAFGAIAMLALPSGADLQTAIAANASPKSEKARGDAAAIAIHLTQTSVRNATSAQSAGVAFAGNAAKF